MFLVERRRRPILRCVKQDPRSISVRFFRVCAAGGFRLVLAARGRDLRNGPARVKVISARLTL